MVNPYRELAGLILCPSGNMLASAQLKPLNNWYIEGCRAAGRELSAAGEISADSQNILSKPLTVAE